MNVLVIPEDFRKDQYILKPLIEAAFALYGRPRAKIRICNPPLLQGVGEALKQDRLQEIVDRYSFVDLFILCVDRDGDVHRINRLNQLEQIFTVEDRPFIAENAWEELETWALAGLPLQPGWSWQAVRSEVSCKEIYFEPLAQEMQVSDGPGGGRKALGAIASRGVSVVIAKCPEDFGRLCGRLQSFLA